MAMGVRAILTGGALAEVHRGCRRPHAGAVGAAEVGTVCMRHVCASWCDLCKYPVPELSRYRYYPIAVG